MPQIPNAHRLRLGHELRRLREQAGVQRTAVADALDCDLSKVSRIENGKQGLSVAEVRLLLGMFGAAKADTDELLDIAREARKRVTHRVPEWVRAFVSYEAEAVEIKRFDVELVSGILQTEAYTRAVTRAADPTRPPAEVERLVAIRRERQARLFGNEPPQLWVVMSEAVIRRVVGGRETMREQLERLREMADLPTISLQILPFSAGAHAAMGSAFAILRMAEPPGAEIVYLEDLWSAAYLDKGPQISAYSVVFDRLCGEALDERGTVAMIEEAVGELR